jgi:hypothetical protein
MHLDVVRMFHRFQGMPSVTRLSTRGFATRLPQTWGAWLGQSITGWRFAAVAAVLRKLIFQRWDAAFQLTDHVDALVKQGQDCFFALLVGSTDLIVCR